MSDRINIAQQLSFPKSHPTPHVKHEGVVIVLLPQEKEYLLASHSPFGSHLVGNFSLWFYFRFPESKIGSKVDSNMFHIAHGMAREGTDGNRSTVKHPKSRIIPGKD